MNDNDLVKQVLTGNKNAFRFLVANHQRLVVHIVGRVVQNREDLEDICQEVFIKVFKKIKHFRGDSRLSTWIAKIAYNTSISHVRKNQLEAQSYDENPGMVAKEKVGDSSQKLLERKEAKQFLMEKIEELPIHYRTVLTLYHLEEFSYREIEEITTMPEGTIKSYLSRARKILKDKLEKVVEIEKTNIFTNYV